MAHAKARGAGRIRPSDRATDDTTAPIAAGVSINTIHVAAIQITESKGMKDNCRRNYQNRNTRYINWLCTEYPPFYEEGTRQLSDEEIAASTNYFFGHKRDLVYSGFRVDVFKAFLSSIKVKKQDEDGNDILKSPQDLRKYGDAR